jgi:3-methyladenine DNA glycosylase Mpg
MKYIVYGAGSPIEVDALSPEIAEAVVIRDYGVELEALVVVRKSDVMLHRRRSS